MCACVCGGVCDCLDISFVSVVVLVLVRLFVIVFVCARACVL